MIVLQFIPSIHIGDGGTTTYMQQLTASLGQLCELHVCALTPVESFVPLSNCHAHAIPSSLYHFSRMKRAWINLLDEVQPDVIHVNCCWLPQIAMITQWADEWRRAPERAKCRIPLFLTPHGMLEPWIMKRNYWTRKLPAIWLYQRRAIKLCDVIVATAEEEREHILQLGWNSNVSLVKNGIDVENIEVKTHWNVAKELLFMSRIHPKKGLDILFEALSRLPDGISFHLTVAGTGDESYVSQLKSKVLAMNLLSNVSFVGAIYGDEKWRMLRDADVVVLPSFSENYGLIVAEALASGTPVLTTTGTPWKSIADNQCGWWISPDPQSIADSLVEISNLSVESVQKMGNNARKLAEIDCTISRKVQQLYKLYLSNRL